ncbi:MAG TPA: daunorubicin/doxorubicin resistance ABC transporter ATP-binding protein DrrA, partial [Catenuloplanes sp.]
DVVVRHRDDLPAVADLMRATGDADPAVDPDTRRVSVPVHDRVAALTGLVRALHEHGLRAEDVAVRRPTLDEVFVHLTAKETR